MTTLLERCLLNNAVMALAEPEHVSHFQDTRISGRVVPEGGVYRSPRINDLLQSR
jgi:hypothetical protein